MYDERRHQAKLISRTVVAKDTYELTFESVDEIEFNPGQYAWIKLLKLLYPDPRGNRRAFSIASPPQDKKKIIIVFRARYPTSGYKQSLIEIPLGTVLIIEAPFGSNVLPADASIPVALVAGGVGVTPFLSMLRDMKKRSSWRPITLIYANKNEGEAAFLDELRQYKKSGVFNLYEVFGPLNDKHFTIAKMPSDTHWYLCGPREMVNIAATLLVASSKKMPIISCDEFFPSILNKQLAISEKELILDTNLYKMAVESASNHIIFTDINGVIVESNKAAQRATGYSREEMIGSTPRIWGGLMERAFYESLWRTIKNERKPFIGKIKNRRANGEIYTVISQISPILNSTGDLIGFLGTEEDITELEQVDKAKTEFVSLASHQLRTPLATISWYIEMLLAGDAGKLNAKHKKYLDEVYKGNKRMVDLVNALLNVSRLELGIFVVEPKPTDVVALARSVIDEQKPQIKVKKLKLNQKYPNNLPKLNADPKLLRMVFHNLLSNAVKYTPEKGKVKIELALSDANSPVSSANYKLVPCILIKVSDTGYGIPKNQQNKIFTKLFRADNVREKDVDGTGLGLYLVKSIIEHSGGNVWFESAENKGTTFYVTLPLAGMKKKEGAKALA